MSLLAQLPKLSQLDEADMPEGGLDPLGLAAAADRLADAIVPGLRARMSQPRFVSLALAGALACQDLTDVVSIDGSTRFDVAFEWLVVEALVVNRPDQLAGVPGGTKAKRARAGRARLSAKSYLSGPRVFGFTGVYRPFAIAAGVVDQDGLPTAAAEPLLRAWEKGAGLPGFVDGTPGTTGNSLRREIREQVLRSLKQGQSTAPIEGQFLNDLAAHVSAQGAKGRERAALRALILEPLNGGARYELGTLLADDLPDETAIDPEIAADLVRRASGETQTRLRAAMAYEDCATLIDTTFRKLLNHAGQHSGLLRAGDAPRLEVLTLASPRVAPLVSTAVAAAENLDVGIATSVIESLSTFQGVRRPTEMFDALMDRHEKVQVAKAKRSWLDAYADDWLVRGPYQTQPFASEGAWSHPMRLRTLVQFLRETS